jgi:hypothetical protein
MMGSVSSDDLTKWLLEQIAEDERAAGVLPADGYPKHDGRVLSVEGTMDVPWPDRWNPSRVLAECDAKRRIIIYHDVILVWPSGTTGAKYYTGSVRRCASCEDVKVLPCPTLRYLALPYADRPGYRDEWRPS